MFNLELIFQKELGSAKIPVGIHKNCKITEVVHVKDEYTDICFEDPTGGVHNKRLWSPKGNYPRDIKLPDGSTQKETLTQAKEREAQSNLLHIVKVLHIVAPDASKNIEGSYDDVIQKVIKVTKPLLPNVRVNLKLIYDAEGKYSTFGKFPDYIETYVEGEEPTLKYTAYEIEKGLSDAPKEKKVVKDDDLI